ncbi:MAG: RidA family protein [Bacteroidales bacterium]|nr:RidA family protein [Bacteroidales bacterium]MBN2818566.1 RidA family protein [Bacteroidales bacterium]
MKKTYNTTNAPQAIGPYNQAVEVNGFVFLSGQIPVNPETGNLVEGGIEEQTNQVFRNIGAVLKEVGINYEHIVKTTCFLKSMDDFQAMNKVYASYLKENQPARSAVEVSRLPKDALIEIEVIAHK